MFSEHTDEYVEELETVNHELVEALEKMVEAFKYLALETKCGDFIAKDAACLRQAEKALNNARWS